MAKKMKPMMVNIETDINGGEYTSNLTIDGVNTITRAGEREVVINGTVRIHVGDPILDIEYWRERQKLWLPLVVEDEPPASTAGRGTKRASSPPQKKAKAKR